MALNSATRLAIITVIGLIIAYIFRPAGLGVRVRPGAFPGAAWWLSTALPVWKKLRTGDWADHPDGSGGGVIAGSEGTEGSTSDD